MNYDHLHNRDHPHADPDVDIGHRVIDGQLFTTVAIVGHEGTHADIFKSASRGVHWAEDVLVAYYGKTLEAARKLIDADVIEAFRTGYKVNE